MRTAPCPRTPDAPARARPELRVATSYGAGVLVSCVAMDSNSNSSTESRRRAVTLELAVLTGRKNNVVAPRPASGSTDHSCIGVRRILTALVPASERIEERVGQVIAPIDRNVVLQLTRPGEVRFEDFAPEMRGEQGVRGRQIAFAIQAQAQRIKVG